MAVIAPSSQSRTQKCPTVLLDLLNLQHDQGVVDDEPAASLDDH